MSFGSYKVCSEIISKRINEVVNRNVERFPEDFYFQLTKEEYNNLRFQNGTTNMSRSLPYVFTEQGVAMLSSVLKSDVASNISVGIMRTFVAMRKYIGNSLLEQKHYKDMILRHDEEIKILQNTFSKFDNFSNELFFEGQIYDAHSLLLDIFNSSKKCIVIIDNYISKELLDVVCKTNNNVFVYTKNMDNGLIGKYNKQYNNLDVNINNGFHDRFIIDDSVLYHCGASFKDLGKKCFAINKIDNIDMINDIKSKL